MKILIIRLSSIGDIILTTPVIRALKEQLNAEVHYLCKEAFAPLVETNSFIDKVWHFNSDQAFKSQLKGLKEEHFDHIVDLHRNLRTQRIIRFLAVSNSTFPKLNVQKWLMVNFNWDLLPDTHIVDRYFKAVEGLGCRNDHRGLDFYIDNNDVIDISEYGLSDKQYCVYSVGAAHQTKQIPIDQAIPLLNQVNLPIVMIGGPGDKEKASIIKSELCGHVVDFSGKCSLHASASLINQSAFIITADTGMMHIAAALKKPTVVFWGNTIPTFGMGPYYGRDPIPSLNIEVEGLRCRPCSKIGYGQCPKGHFKCMKQWNPLEIAERINTFYRREINPQWNSIADPT